MLEYFMEIIGWIFLWLFALVGLAVIGYALYEFIMVQLRVMKHKLAKDSEVRKEDINARAEIKRQKLAEKRGGKVAETKPMPKEEKPKEIEFKPEPKEPEIVHEPEPEPALEPEIQHEPADFFGSPTENG